MAQLTRGFGISQEDREKVNGMAGLIFRTSDPFGALRVDRLRHTEPTIRFNAIVEMAMCVMVPSLPWPTTASRLKALQIFGRVERNGRRGVPSEYRAAAVWRMLLILEMGNLGIGPQPATQLIDAEEMHWPPQTDTFVYRAGGSTLTLDLAGLAEIVREAFGHEAPKHP